jgi:hypothetical protein
VTEWKGWWWSAETERGVGGGRGCGGQVSVAAGPALACGAAVPLYSNLSRTVDPKGVGAGRGIEEG